MHLSAHESYLHSLPSDWERVPLGVLGPIVSGGTPSRESPRLWNGSIAWVTPGELTQLSTKWLSHTRDTLTEKGLQNSAARLLPLGSLLVTTRATIGASAIATIPICTNQGFKSIIFTDQRDALFYYFVLQFIGSELTRLASGTTFDEISRTDFERILVPRPQDAERRSIAQILEGADVAIQQTEAVIAKLRQVRAGLLHDLLTRGLDAQGRLRDPRHHPEQFKDSPLGRIPSEWGVMTLEELTPPTAPICYGIVQPGEYIEGGITVLAIQDLEGDYHSNIHRCHPAIDSQYARSRVLPKDVLLSIKGTIGRVGIVPEDFRGNISRDLARIRSLPGVSPSFLRHLLSSPSGQVALQQIVVGTTRAELSIAPLRRVVVPIPPRPEQDRIATHIDEIDVRLCTEEAYLSKLKLQKRGLMHDLLTGRLRV